MNAIRTRDAQNGTATPGTPGLPTSIKGDEPQFVKDYFDYYKTERAFTPVPSILMVHGTPRWLFRSSICHC